ncbi:MAG: exodeoxyribonuclease VII small subunit [Betaproteobacteria bacterium]|nr:exodeoxyribonuclease VII small subunit [Betaproteobacteria bacterium]
MPKAAPKPIPQSFETSLAELETIVRNLEAGGLSLEQSLGAYQRGMALLKQCQTTLNDAEQRIRVLEGGSLQEISLAGGDEADA